MEKFRYNFGKSGQKDGSLLFPVSQWRCSSDIWWILWKFCCPPDDTFVLLDVGVMSDPPPPPSPLSSSLPPPPTQLLGSSQRSWTVIDAIGSPRDPDLSRLSAPAPRVEGSWIGHVSKKVSRGRKNLVQLTYPTKDSISLPCTTPHPLLAPGTSWSQPPQLPGENIPFQSVMGAAREAGPWLSSMPF